ncbi:hypothetical protein KGF54_001869 [Candida jiufengensis]|uniref:uncharacterized protein n=1 Tax=Candida jiufengensis TaxID=497108 RepID=UPI0022249960|nr:uncharacterized protein KGF54_001869 [Candida jiufengensis]KAI5955308.1 hypothetical protein KGF54_001869 [Candida jiufengensis]
MLSKFEKSKNLNNLNSSNYNKKYQNENYKKVKYITVKGMGKTIEKTLKIAMNYQNDQNYKVDILTGSVQVLDEFEKSHTSQIDSIEDAVDNTICTKDSIEENHFDGPEREYQKRMVSYVEARVWLKRE